MKKLIALATAVLMMGALAACETGDSGTSPTGNTSSGSSVEETASNGGEDTSSDDAEAKDVELSIVSTSLGKDYAGEDILIVEYSFTNNTDKANSFMILCNDKVFQNGVECGETVISDEIDAQQQLNDVQPGATYTLKVGYMPIDPSVPVEVTVTDLLGLDTYLSETINLE